MPIKVETKELLAGGKAAIATLHGEGVLPWGTKVEEHRINPELVAGVNKALDDALSDPAVRVVVVTGTGKFWSNGMDLKYIAAHPAKADELQESVERLLGRILAFPLPTIAAINGHFVAAGAMLGLAFDYRVAGPKGLFFVPGIDIGLVYSPGMTALMTCKTPLRMHRDMIIYGKRFNFTELAENQVVQSIASETHLIMNQTLDLAEKIAPKGSSPQYRTTMAAIKANLYRTAVDALASYDAKVNAMGFQNVPEGQDRPTKDQMTAKL